MSDIKNLIKPESHDPYHRHGIVPYLTSLTKAHADFFAYMKDEGYDLYTKPDFLRNKIMEFAKKLSVAIREEDNQLSMNPKRNLQVAPRLTDDDIRELVWKWQGNLLEIVAGHMFETCNPFADRYVFDEMCGDSKDDAGVDGWLRSTANSKFFIGVQVKFRFEKDVKWNDQITKALALTDERIRKLYQSGLMTRDEWCDWGMKIQRRAVLVTTTRLSDSVTEMIGTDAFDVVDQDTFLKFLGKKKGVNPNRKFWESLYARLA